MKKMLLAATVAVAGASAAFADGHSATLAATLERGTVKCGVNTGVPGFAQAVDGVYQGLSLIHI